MPHDINVRRHAPANLAATGNQSPPRQYLLLTNMLSPGPVAELMASKVYLSKTRRLLIIQSPEPPRATIFTVLQGASSPSGASSLKLLSHEPQFHLLCRYRKEEEEEEGVEVEVEEEMEGGTFITDQKTSLEVPESKHD